MPADRDLLPTAPAKKDPSPQVEGHRQTAWGQTTHEPSKRLLSEVILALFTVAVVAGGSAGLATREFDLHTLSATNPSSNLSSKTLDIAGIVDKVEPALVTISGLVKHEFGFGSVAGSGIILTSNGEVLTNAHVVAGAGLLQVWISAQSRSESVQVVATDPADDIALLRVTGDAGLLPTAPLGDSSRVQVGDQVVAVGNSLDLSGPPTVTSGIISALNRSFGLGDQMLGGLIQTDAPISSGNSGGMLIDAQGNVIGVTTLMARSTQDATAENVNFAIPIDTAIKIADSLGATVTTP